VPVSTPAGILILNFFLTCFTPLPPQVTHGSAIIWPAPLHEGHSATCVKLPKGVLVALLTCPLPPHVEQVFGPVPGFAPVPLQTSHVSK